MPFTHIENAIAAIKRGELVIVVDDADRENEGDLVIAAEKVTAQAINFMAREGRGLICVALTEERCAALELPRRTAAMEFDLDAVPLPDPVLAPRVSGYPPALIDVALVVPADTPAGQVEASLVDGAGRLLESVRLFDVYESEQLGAGRKSLAYKLTFRAPDRTLTVEEALAARDAAVAVAADRFGATLRGA